MPDCIINFSDGNHVISQERLRESLNRVSFSGKILFWTNVLPAGCPNQNESPWAFKAFCFEEARKLGYKNVLWVDSSIMFIRNPNKIFDVIDKQGYFIFSNFVSNVDGWSSDYTLDKLKIDRQTAKLMPEIRAHVIGLNTENKIAMSFLYKWINIAKDGISFRGLPIEVPLLETFTNNGKISKEVYVKGHRHDQTVASILVWQLKMRISNKFSIDYMGEIKNKNRPISLDTIVLQDRSYKYTGQARMIDKYENKKGLNKIFYIGLSLIYTTVKFFRRRRKLRLQNV